MWVGFFLLSLSYSFVLLSADQAIFLCVSLHRERHCCRRRGGPADAVKQKLNFLKTCTLFPTKQLDFAFIFYSPKWRYNRRNRPTDEEGENQKNRKRANFSEALLEQFFLSHLKRWNKNLLFFEAAPAPLTLTVFFTFFHFSNQRETSAWHTHTLTQTQTERGYFLSIYRRSTHCRITLYFPFSK